VTDRTVLARLYADRTRLAGLLGTLVLVGTVAFLLSPLVVTIPGDARVFVDVFIIFALFGLVVLGLNLQYGYAGLINFGPVAFYLVGGYATAIIVAENPDIGTGFDLVWPVGVAGGVVVAGVLGVLVGAATLKIREDFLAIVTLAAAEVLLELFINVRRLAGGTDGMVGLPRPIYDLAGNSDTGLLGSALVFGSLVLVVYALFSRLTDAPYGRVLRGIRGDELATRTLGKNTFRYKMAVFVYGSMIAGLAGSLLVLHNGGITPGFFTVQVTIVLWIGMLIGGPGKHWATLVGLAIIVALRLITRFGQGTVPELVPLLTPAKYGSLRLFAIGLILVVIIRYRPHGIWGNEKEVSLEQ
jgi:branched-chain amino acid transport system permease protein